MSRNGSGVYSLPAGSVVANGDVSDASDLNTPLADLEADANVARPIVAGGTGASSAADALVNLGLTATAAEINILDGATVSTAEINVLDGLTASTAELNILDGATLTVTELNYVDGVTSAIQTQIDAKAALASPALTGTPTAPTAAVGTDTTQIATTAYVRDEVPNVLNAAGSAPIYGCRAWGSFDATDVSGTYSRSGTTVTVTMTAHGMTTGQGANLQFTSGTATTGFYFITVTDANTFTVTDSASGATSGNVTRRLWLKGHGNIASMSVLGTGYFGVTFATAMDDAYYALIGSASKETDASSTARIVTIIAANVTASGFRIHTETNNATLFDCEFTNFAVFR